jgi:hypothetical protein
MGEVWGWRGNCALLKAVVLGTASILVISSLFKTLLIHIFNISVITPVGEVRPVPFVVTLNIKEVSSCHTVNNPPHYIVSQTTARKWF